MAKRSTPWPPGAKKRMGLLARASQLVGAPVVAAIPLQRHRPAAVLAASAAEIASLAALIATGSLAAMAVLIAASVCLVATTATNTRRVLVLTGKGNVLLAASGSGWPEGVVGPALRHVPIPKPVGLGVSLDLEGTTWWVDRASFRLLRQAMLVQADGYEDR